MAVDAVLIIGEHGDYPRNEKGQILYPRYEFFREVSQGRIKVSLRSVGDVDVAAFAKEFGGGGHTKAAGLALAGTLADVQATVLGAARAYLTADGGDGRSTS